MSFADYKDVIGQGDTVILYMSNTMHAIEVQPEIKNKKGVTVENVFQTTFGALKVRSLIGQKYGNKVSRTFNFKVMFMFTCRAATIQYKVRIDFDSGPSLLLKERVSTQFMKLRIQSQ